jgi:hypothetical protein
MFAGIVTVLMLMISTYFARITEGKPRPPSSIVYFDKSGMKEIIVGEIVILNKK